MVKTIRTYCVSIAFSEN